MRSRHSGSMDSRRGGSGRRRLDNIDILETEGVKGGIQSSVVIVVEAVVITDEQREYDEANPTVGVGMRD
jgi:hypothetical protein